MRRTTVGKMKKMLECSNDKCDWIGEQRDLKEVTKTPVWGCPKCEQIFFKYVFQEKSE